VKSILRSKGRKRGPRNQGAEAASVAETAAEPVEAAPNPLETLEERIDDCLQAARRMDPEPSVENLLSGTWGQADKVCGGDVALSRQATERGAEARVRRLQALAVEQDRQDVNVVARPPIVIGPPIPGRVRDALHEMQLRIGSDHVSMGLVPTPHLGLDDRGQL